MYSLQFEFGPFSEAAIGNLGLRTDTSGWVDHVVTPAGAPWSPKMRSIDV